jgi:hypothetical protein
MARMARDTAAKSAESRSRTGKAALLACQFPPMNGVLRRTGMFVPYRMKG